MENKNKKYKIISIIAVILSIIGLSLGYAAYTETLNIMINGNIVPDDKFSDNIFYDKESDIIFDSNTNLEHNNGILDGSNWKNLSVIFKHPGEECSFKAKINNDSNFDAYLVSINTDGGIITSLGSSSILSSETHWTKEEISNYNTNFKVNVYIEIDGNKTLISSIGTNIINKTCDLNGTIKSNKSAYIIIEFEYDSNAKVVDFPINLSVPDIKLTWSTYNSSTSCIG